MSGKNMIFIDHASTNQFRGVLVLISSYSESKVRQTLNEKDINLRKGIKIGMANDLDQHRYSYHNVDSDTFEKVKNFLQNKLSSFSKTYWPTESGRVSGKFGERFFRGKKEFHSGVDFGQAGSTGKVYASVSGVVTQVGKTSTGNNYLKIRDNEGFSHGYFHTKSFVRVGDDIEAGQLIGKSDMSGRSTGLHLHYVLQTGSNRSTRIDPFEYLELRNPIYPGN